MVFSVEVGICSKGLRLMGFRGNYNFVDEYVIWVNGDKVSVCRLVRNEGEEFEIS